MNATAPRPAFWLALLLDVAAIAALTRAVLGTVIP